MQKSGEFAPEVSGNSGCQCSLDWLVGKNLHRKPIGFYHKKIMCGSCKFPLEPIGWLQVDLQRVTVIDSRLRTTKAYPLVNIQKDGKSPFLMGKSKISMTIFNS